MQSAQTLNSERAVYYILLYAFMLAYVFILTACTGSLFDVATSRVLGGIDSIYAITYRY
jgi:hypothetical protein